MRKTPSQFQPRVESFEPRALLSALTPPPVSAEIRASALFDTASFPSERAKLSPLEFPLLGSNYEVLAPSSKRYNCLDSALGSHNRWISFKLGPKSDPLAWTDHILGKEGYVRQPDLDTSLQPGEQKIAVFGFTNRLGAVSDLEHAALQLSDGTWTSKLGTGPLIRTPFAESVSNPAYGPIIAVYARPV